MARARCEINIFMNFDGVGFFSIFSVKWTSELFLLTLRRVVTLDEQDSAGTLERRGAQQACC